jgi:hypothetical protein
VDVLFAPDPAPTRGNVAVDLAPFSPAIARSCDNRAEVMIG